MIRGDIPPGAPLGPIPSSPKREGEPKRDSPIFDVVQRSISPMVSPPSKELSESSDITHVSNPALQAVTHPDGLWEAREVKEVPEGKIYKFFLRDDCNSHKNIFSDVSSLSEDDLIERKEVERERIKSLYPAPEPTYDDAIRRLKHMHQDHFKTYGTKLEKVVLPLFQDPSDPDGSLENVMKDLGYFIEMTKDGEISVTYPDKNVFDARWKMLGENPKIKVKLPPFSIMESEGVAPDKGFTEALFVHDALLSKGVEFVHDQHFHVLQTLLLLIRYPKDYAELKERKIRDVKNICNRIEKMKAWYAKKLKYTNDDEMLRLNRLKTHLDIAYIIPGKIMDTLSAFNNPTDFKAYLRVVESDHLMKQVLVQEKGFSKRFAEEKTSIDIPWLWEKLCDMK